MWMQWVAACAAAVLGVMMAGWLPAQAPSSRYSDAR